MSEKICRRDRIVVSTLRCDMPECVQQLASSVGKLLDTFPVEPRLALTAQRPQMDLGINHDGI